MGWYERLSAQDASFLVYEDRDASAHMHVGGVSVYEAGAFSNPRGGVDVEKFRDYVASRLHMIPRYRQRLAYLPLSGDPIWVDDDRFNVRYHVRHTRLPRPGDERELKRLSARIMSQRLDRHRPLWELWLIEGLPDGRFALVTKTHHCMIDGVSGVDISTVLMQMAPDDTAIEAAVPWEPRPAPSTATLSTEEFRRRASIPVDRGPGSGADGARVALGAGAGCAAISTVSRSSYGSPGEAWHIRRSIGRSARTAGSTGRRSPSPTRRPSRTGSVEP